MIFIHGAGQDHTNWQLPARWFAWHGHAALAPDLPGHGRSDGPPLETIADMAQWIGRLMDAAKLEKAALVGHSMGGGIAVEAAAAMPERIYAHRAARHVAFHAGQRGAADGRARRARAGAPDDHRVVARAAARKIGGNPAPGLWMSGGTHGAAVAATGRARCMPPSMPATSGRPGPEAAARVRCPALVLIGANDSMTPPKIGRALADKIAGSRTVVIPTAAT